MRKQSLILLISMSVFSTALAQPAQRTFVSAATGSDSNLCTRAAPCRQFLAAITQTTAGGEIIVLDSGGYGTVTITKAVSIIAPPGVYAGVTGFSGEAILINAGGSDVIVLRGLSLNGLGALYGIRFISGAELHGSGLDVSKFNVSGIHFITAGFLILRDSRFRENGSGILLDTATGTANGSLERIAFDKNVLYGLEVRDNTVVAVRQSVTVGGDRGIIASPDNASPGTAVLDVENCLVTHAVSGITSGANTVIRVSNSTIVSNTFGLIEQDGSGSIISRSNNTVEGNGSDGTFTTTFAAK